jgi:hypothetical protein
VQAERATQPIKAIDLKVFFILIKGIPPPVGCLRSNSVSRLQGRAERLDDSESTMVFDLKLNQGREAFARLALCSFSCLTSLRALGLLCYN